MNTDATYKQAGLTVGMLEVAPPYSSTGKPLKLVDPTDVDKHYFPELRPIPKHNQRKEHWWPVFLRWVGNLPGCRWLANLARSLTLRCWR